MGFFHIAKIKTISILCALCLMIILIGLIFVFGSGKENMNHEEEN